MDILPDDFDFANEYQHLPIYTVSHRPLLLLRISERSMSRLTRRQLLQQVGQGMIVASIGVHGAEALGLGTVLAEEGDDTRLRFGKWEPLVGLLQETPPDRLLPVVVEKLRQGTPLSDLVAAGALANARAFGGDDYVGFHTLMALTPSFQMAARMPEQMQALPVLKVLHRNSRRIHERDQRGSDTLQPIIVSDGTNSGATGEALRHAVRGRDKSEAERIFARIASGSVDHAFNELLVAVEDADEVHRVVLPYKARELADIVGVEHAHTLLRQSVRFCVNAESDNYSAAFLETREILPKLFDEYRLLEPRTATRPADAATVTSLTDAIFRSTPADAAAAVAAALADGLDWKGIGEAISLAANQLVLRDLGRPESQSRLPEKPPGSIHGDSIGVHAGDSANAWRNMAGYANPHHRQACLILGAHQVATDRIRRGGKFLEWEPWPTAEHRERISTGSPEELLKVLEGAIRENDQPLAAAATRAYGDGGFSVEPLFTLLLNYAISEDGALHAEKYYGTVLDDYRLTRPDLRWNHVVGLARVTASAFGFPAPGVAEARELLKS